jgi:transcriptional accessory protein Tex/SPT6
VVKVGQIVKVKVLEVDVQRKRIQLTMRLDDASSKNRPLSDKNLVKKDPPRAAQAIMKGGFADLLQNALKR